MFLAESKSVTKMRYVDRSFGKRDATFSRNIRYQNYIPILPYDIIYLSQDKVVHAICRYLFYCI